MIVIEKARNENLEEVQRLYQQLFSLMAQYQPYYFKAAEQNREFLEDIILNESFAVLLAKEENNVLGFVIVQKQITPPYTCLVQHKYAYIMDIVVDEKCRGKGVGRMLLAAAESWARSEKVDYLELGVLTENISAQKLYINEGYELTNHIMRKRLA